MMTEDPLYNLAKEVLTQDKEIAELKQQNADLRAALEQQPQPDVVLPLFMQLGEARDEIAALKAKWDAVPVDAIRRYWMLSKPIEDGGVVGDECLVHSKAMSKWFDVMEDGA